MRGDAGDEREAEVSKIFAFEVSVAGTDWTKIINAQTAGKAKYQYWQDVTDAWPDVPITAMRARKFGDSLYGVLALGFSFRVIPVPLVCCNGQVGARGKGD